MIAIASYSSGVDPVADLVRRGAHLVLLGGGSKLPLWRGWPARKPCAAVAIRHLDDQAGALGVVPWSLGETVVDVDAGDPARLHALCPPRVSLPTRRGLHDWYDDNLPRKNRNGVDVAGVRMDVRGERGYVKLHGGRVGIEALLSGLSRVGRYPFGPVADLFELAGEPALGVRAQSGATAPAAATLEYAFRGARNHALFNALRRWAYRAHDLDEPLTVWHERCLDKARALAATLPIPFSQGDTKNSIDATAWSVAGYCRSPRCRVPWSPAVLTARRRKGGIVRARRARRAVLDRDRAIVAMLDAGVSMRQTAERLTVTGDHGRVTKRAVQTARHRLAVAEVEAAHCSPSLFAGL